MSDSPGRRGFKGSGHRLGAAETQEGQRERRVPCLLETLAGALAQHGVGGSGQRGEWPGSAGGGHGPSSRQLGCGGEKGWGRGGPGPGTWGLNASLLHCWWVVPDARLSSFLPWQRHSPGFWVLSISAPRHGSQIPHSGTPYLLFLLSGVFFPERFPQLALSHGSLSHPHPASFLQLNIYFLQSSYHPWK